MFGILASSKRFEQSTPGMILIECRTEATGPDILIFPRINDAFRCEFAIVAIKLVNNDKAI